jgi:hypothetical protein
MGLLTTLLFFPIAGPAKGIRWSLEQVRRVAEEELTDDRAIKEELLELQLLLELGDIDESEYRAREARLMERLREVREWRERLGRPVSGGAVRVVSEERTGA